MSSWQLPVSFPPHHSFLFLFLLLLLLLRLFYPQPALTDDLLITLASGFFPRVSYLFDFTLHLTLFATTLHQSVVTLNKSSSRKSLRIYLSIVDSLPVRLSKSSFSYSLYTSPRRLPNSFHLSSDSLSEATFSKFLSFGSHCFVSFLLASLFTIHQHSHIIKNNNR